MSTQALNPYNNTSSWEFHNIDDDKASEVAEKIKSTPTLLALSIIGPFENNAVSLGAAGGKAIINAVEKHPAIQSLNLEGNNGMGDEIAFSLFKMLVKNKSLTSLNVRDCGLSDKKAELIAEGIKMNKSLRELYIDTNCFRQGYDVIIAAANKRNIYTDVGGSPVTKRSDAQIESSTELNAEFRELKLNAS